MDKIKFLAFMAATAVFFACGSQESGSPAKLKKEYVSKASPFDTLIAEFDSKIVINKLSDTNIIRVPQNVDWVFPDGQRPSTSSKLYFVGTYNTTPGGLSYFKPNDEGSVKFLNLENDDGYIQKNAVLHYSMLDILDREPNDGEINANYIDSTTVTDGVIFAGVLDHKISQPTGTIYDIDDYYRVKLCARDSITITVSNFREDLEIIITGPLGAERKTFTVAKNKSNTFFLEPIKAASNKIRAAIMPKL